MKATLGELLGSKTHHILKSQDPEEPAESFRAQRLYGPGHMRPGDFPMKIICWPVKSPNGASGVVHRTKHEFCSNSNNILRKMETKIVWGLCRGMWNL